MTELLAFVARPGENLGRHWRLGRITEGRGQIVDWAVSLTTDHHGRGHLVVVESSGSSAQHATPIAERGRHARRRKKANGAA